MKTSTLFLIVMLLWRAAGAATSDVGTVARATEAPGLTTGMVTSAFMSAAEDPGKAAAMKVSDSGSQLKGGIWRSLGATLLVLGLLFGANYWLRRRGSGFGTVGRSGRLRIVDRVPVDPRRGILLLEADGERIVVSVGTDRIETLAVLPAAEGKWEEAE